MPGPKVALLLTTENLRIKGFMVFLNVQVGKPEV